MNDFEIISKLGEGAYSTVYKVKRLIDGNIYALKKVKLLNLSEKEKENALNEVRLLASVKSNFVISYKEAFFDEKDSTLGIVMEFADRGDLYQKIIEHKKNSVLFEESDIWRIFIQLVKGLKSLHELKILHRDLKSANVFLLSDGSAKLGDLNVSKVARRGIGYTQTGTPYYASPEVWKDKPYDNKSDIWSLGCVLYEMIALKPPFRAQSMEGLYQKVIKGQFNKIPDKYSNDLFSIVKLLIQVNPEKRPNCEDILKNNIIQKRIEYFKSFSNNANNDVNNNSGDNFLLKTIHIPKNLLFLSDKLPKPNYEKLNDDDINQNQVNTKKYRSYNGIKDKCEIQQPKQLNILPKATKIELELPNIDNILEKNKKEVFVPVLKKSGSLNNIVQKSSCGSRIDSGKLNNGNNNSKSVANIDPSVNLLVIDKHNVNNLSLPKKKIIIRNVANNGNNIINSYKRINNINLINGNQKLNALYNKYVHYLNVYPSNKNYVANKYYKIPGYYKNYNNGINQLGKYYNIGNKDSLKINGNSFENSKSRPDIRILAKRKLSPLKRNMSNLC